MRILGIVMPFLVAVQGANMIEVRPKDLAAQLQSNGPKPALFHVGFGVIYRSKHIPGSIYAGPGSRAQGLEALKAAAAGLPRDREVVVYCGCCPWDDCPNVKPAVELLSRMGFKRVKALVIRTNFASDWIDHGYPIERSPATK